MSLKWIGYGNKIYFKDYANKWIILNYWATWCKPCHEEIPAINHFYEKLLRRIYTPSLDQIWFLQNISYSRKTFYRLVKTVLDFVFGLIAFIIFDLAASL